MEEIKNITALYFGSFNPLHYGHLALAEYVVANSGLTNNYAINHFWFVLSPHNPFKSPDILGNASERLSVLKNEVDIFKRSLLKKYEANLNDLSGRGQAQLLNIRNIPIEVSDIEFSLPEPRYTFNTLRELRRIYPQREFYIVVGADSFYQMEKWYRGEDILFMYKTIVYPRKGYSVKRKAARYGAIYLDKAPLNDISSTEVRNGSKEQFSI